MKLLKILLMILILVSFFKISSAVGLILLTDKENYFMNDTLKVTAEINNPLNENLILTAILWSEKYRSMPVAFKINNSEEKNVTLFYFKVNDGFPLGKYHVTAEIYANSKLLLKKNISFEIITPKDIKFKLRVCADSDCHEEKSVFRQGEKIYLRYDSDPKDVNLSVTLKLPDNTTKSILLPATLSENILGTYNIFAVVKKTRYKTHKEHDMFAVISNNISVGSCNYNGRCETNENYLTCKKDCPSGSKDGVCDMVKDGQCDPDCVIQNLTNKDPDCVYKKGSVWWIYVLSGFGILILLFILFTSIKINK